MPLSKNKKTKTISQQLKDILDKVSHQDLKGFIQEQSNIDEQFRNLFLSSFAHLNEGQSKEFYKKQVKSIVNLATDRHGFIGWHEMKHLEQGIYPIIAIAEKQVESNNYLSAIYIYSALMEELTAAIQFSDDSSGLIGGIIDSSYKMLFDIATKDISEDIKIEFFNYCVRAFKQQIFYGWDWHTGVLNIACKLTDNEDEADIVLNCLDTVQEEYDKRTAQSLKLGLLSKYKGSKVAQKFIDRHITNPSIRNTEIEKTIINKDFEKAISLCEGGIEYDGKHRPGLVKNWYNRLLEIAQYQNNKTKTIECLEYLFTHDFHSEKGYYLLLKQEIEPDKWKAFLEDLIKEIKLKAGWRSDILVREIYINEKWWDKLFLLLLENPSLENITNNEEYLSKEYSEALIQLYSDRLIEYLDRNMGRKYYQRVCRYLGRIKKLGGNERANQLIAYFKKTYPQRKALMDELSRV